MESTTKILKGKLEVEWRSDACCYLEYIVDMQAGKHNRYRCSLLHGGKGSHTCEKWGWCPMAELAKERGDPLLTERFDIRTVFHYA